MHGRLDSFGFDAIWHQLCQSCDTQKSIKMHRTQILSKVVILFVLFCLELWLKVYKLYIKLSKRQYLKRHHNNTSYFLEQSSYRIPMMLPSFDILFSLSLHIFCFPPCFSLFTLLFLNSVWFYWVIFLLCFFIVSIQVFWVMFPPWVSSFQAWNRLYLTSDTSICGTFYNHLVSIYTY